MLLHAIECESMPAVAISNKLVQFRLPKQTHERLEKVASEKGRTLAGHARWCVEQNLSSDTSRQDLCTILESILSLVSNKANFKTIASLNMMLDQYRRGVQ